MQTAAFVLAVLGLIGCGAMADKADETRAARAEIEEVTRRWEAALRAGRPQDAVAEVFSPDAVRLPSGAPAVRGQAAIAAALAGSAPLVEARFTIGDLEVDGGLAFANGVYRVKTAEGWVLGGKFLEVWKRTPDGWRIHRVMWD